MDMADDELHAELRFRRGDLLMLAYETAAYFENVSNWFGKRTELKERVMLLQIIQWFLRYGRI
jgi:hypothetical protein